MMLRVLICFILFVGSLADVREVNDKDMDELENKDYCSFVVFKAPWCGHCKAIAPEVEKLDEIVKTLATDINNLPEGVEKEKVELLKSTDLKIRVINIDATLNPKMAEKYKIQGYPTIKLFRKTDVLDYSGGRSVVDMLNYMLKKCGPMEKITKVEKLDEYIENNSQLVFGYFKDPKSDSYAAFEAVSNTMDTPLFYYSDLPELAKHLKVDTAAHKEAIVYVRKFDEGPLFFYGPFTEDDISKFIKGNKLPLVSEFNQENAADIFNQDNQRHFLLFEHKNASKHEDNMERFKEAAKDFKGQILFVYIDSNEDTNARILEFFGIKEHELPTLRIINLEGAMKKYKPDVAHDSSDKANILPASELKAFVKEYLAGNLKPHLLSDPIPEDWDSKPVKVLVGENFNSLLDSSEKRILVEFYAPWCTHCKQLEPIYDELGEDFKNNPNVVIAKIDSTTNEIDNITIGSFPTIKLFLPNAEGPRTSIDFGGERTKKALTEFIESDGEKHAMAHDQEEGEGEETEPYDEDEETGAGDHPPEHTEL